MKLLTDLGNIYYLDVADPKDSSFSVRNEKQDIIATVDRATFLEAVPLSQGQIISEFLVDYEFVVEATLGEEKFYPDLRHFLPDDVVLAITENQAVWEVDKQKLSIRNPKTGEVQSLLDHFHLQNALPSVLGEEVSEPLHSDFVATVLEKGHVIRSGIDLH